MLKLTKLRSAVSLRFVNQTVLSYRRLSVHLDTMTEQNGAKVVDLRSDTLTKPLPGMRKAMAEAEVGDDVYGEDPTVNELQSRCAELFGKEDALFVPTGTMGNLISILVHCQGRGLEAIVGHKSHILLNEQGGLSQFAGVLARTIENRPDGTFDIAELSSLIRPLDDPHQPHTRVICVENTHNYCGGKALPLDFLKQVWEIAQEHSIKVHTDGARIINSANAIGLDVSEILKYTHSVSMCFSKGLAAPVGSIIAGDKDFICMARRMRKALGGGMRQAGVLAAAALYSLDNVVPRLHEDHHRAMAICQAIQELNSPVVKLCDEGVLTNIVMFEIIKPGVGAKDFVQRLLKVTEEEEQCLGESITVVALASYPHIAKIVTHNDVDSDMIQLAIKKLKYVIREYENN